MLPFRRRKRVRKDRLRVWLILAALLAALGTTTSHADKEKGKGGKRQKQGGGAAASSPTGEVDLTNIPLPVGHEAKGLVLPDFDAEGRLVGRFEAGVARRLDEQRVAFRDLKITTFTPENQVDLQVEMHT